MMSFVQYSYTYKYWKTNVWRKHVSTWGSGDTMLINDDLTRMAKLESTYICINPLRLRQNDLHVWDNILKCIFVNENVWILLNISLKFVPKIPINNIPALVHIMTWPRPGDKPLSEQMMVSLVTHVCITRPQWVNFYTENWQLSWSQHWHHWWDQRLSNNNPECIQPWQSWHYEHNWFSVNGS